MLILRLSTTVTSGSRVGFLGHLLIMCFELHNSCMWNQSKAYFGALEFLVKCYSCRSSLKKLWQWIYAMMDGVLQSAERSGSSMLNVSRSLDTSTPPTTQPASNKNQRKKNRKITGTSHTPVIERDYTISIPKLLDLQAKHGVSDAAVDDILR